MTAQPVTVDEFFRGLKPRSKESVSEALRALRRPGVSATLVIQIPADEAKPCEIMCLLAPVQVVVDLTKL